MSNEKRERQNSGARIKQYIVREISVVKIEDLQRIINIFT